MTMKDPEIHQRLADIEACVEKLGDYVSQIDPSEYRGAIDCVQSSLSWMLDLIRDLHECVEKQRIAMTVLLIEASKDA